MLARVYYIPHDNVRVETAGGDASIVGRPGAALHLRCMERPLFHRRVRVRIIGGLVGNLRVRL